MNILDNLRFQRLPYWFQNFILSMFIFVPLGCFGLVVAAFPQVLLPILIGGMILLIFGMFVYLFGDLVRMTLRNRR